MKLLALLFILSSSIAHAEIKKPEIHRLSNGLTVALFEDHKLPLVDFVLLVPYGTIHDPARKSGTAQLTVEVLEREVMEQIENKGGTSYSGVDGDSITLGLHGLSADQDALFDLLLKWALKPSWNQEVFNKEKNKLIDRWRHLDDQTSFLAAHGIQRRLTSRTPYARGGMLSEVELQTVTLSDLVGYYQSYLKPNRATLLVVGNIDPKKWMSTAEAKLAQWTGKAETHSLQNYVNTRYEATPDVIIGIDKPGSPHADIKFAVDAPSFKSKEHFDLLIANSIFGETFNSWLNTKIRDQLGYVYSIGSSFSHSIGFSSWGVSTSTNPEQIGLVLSSIYSLYSDFQKAKFSSDEIAGAKNYLVGSFSINNSSVGQIASRWLAGRLFDLNEDYLETFTGRVKAVADSSVYQSVKIHFAKKTPKVVIACDRAKCEKSLVSAGFKRLQWLKASDLK